MYREWSKNPNTLHCGTPYSNTLGCDLKFEVTITERNEDSKLRAVDETPKQFFQRLSRIPRSVVSKAAERSRSRSAVERPASSETKMSF